jgi:hypothetical protein
MKTRSKEELSKELEDLKKLSVKERLNRIESMLQLMNSTTIE